MLVVDRMLQLAEVRKDDVVYDLGSGDGRVLIRAAKMYGAKGVGVDMDPKLVEQARRNAVEEGVSHLVEFRAGDALKVDISEATVVTLYMYKWFNNQMRPQLQRLRPASRVVAHDFDIDDWKPTKVEYVSTSPHLRAVITAHERGGLPSKPKAPVVQVQRTHVSIAFGERGKAPSDPLLGARLRKDLKAANFLRSPMDSCRVLTVSLETL
jgi:SAM-dependent methyltransferase